MRRLVIPGLLLVVLASPLALAGVVMALAETGTRGGAPSEAALADIPASALAAYQDAVAARCPGLSWAVLAAVGKIESDHGRISPPPILGPRLDGAGAVAAIADSDGGRLDADPVWDRAVGPMQFLPSTWARYGVDGDGDGVADPHNIVDAAHSAAAYLCANGASDPQRVREALYAYNHSWDYVERVLAQADAYTAAPSLEGLQVADPPTIAAVLNNPRLVIYAEGRADIAAGLIDHRVLQLLQTLSQRYTLHVSSLRSGHSRCVGGGDYPACSVSNHWHGRAADFFRVNGQPVNAANPEARAIVAWLATLQGPLRPDEVGSPWPEFEALSGHFSDSAHRGHVHFGWD